MKKVILVTGIAFALLSFTGIKGGGKAAEITGNSIIPKEKRELLKKIVGRWITQTNVYARNGKPASKVIGSDIWQWSPDGNFTLHMAYGIHDNTGFGAMEITGYNPKTGDFDSYNFNPDGSFEMFTLTINGNTWIWEGKEVKTTGVMAEDGKTLTVKHEITENGKPYEEFMETVLRKGSDY